MNTVNNIDKEIQDMKDALKALEQKAEAMKHSSQIEKWSPRVGNLSFSYKRDIVEFHTTEYELEIGRTFRSPGEAKSFQLRDTVRTRLDAYVREFDKGWEANFNDIEQVKCFIYYSTYTKDYAYGVDRKCCNIGGIYMSRECAEELVKKLNSGEVEL